METFTDLDLSEQVLENLKRKKYDQPTPIQSKVIPVILEKRDVVMQSQTGSGKTAAFGLPLIQNVMEDVPAVQFVVLVPTRELAFQVFEELKELAQGTNVKICSIYGGSSMGAQIQALRGGAQIVIGTPGRVLDHLKRRTMSFSVVRGVVLDEADKMLSMGFFPDVQLIFKSLPKRRQSIMSSATFPYTVERLIYQYMHEPVRISMSTDDMSPKEIEHLYCNVESNRKEEILLAFLEKEQPDASLIFCNTKIDVKSVHLFLSNAGIQAEGLSSDLSQPQREKVLNKLRTGLVQHLVCTDLAARGIDIPNLSHVFVFSSSGDSETYVHRTGRTGRAGKSGKAISLVSTLDLAGFKQALRVNQIEAVEIQAPTEEEIVSARMEHDYKYLESVDFGRDADVRDEFTQLAEKLSSEQVQSMLPLLLAHFCRPEPPSGVISYEPPPPQSDTPAPSQDRPPRERGRGDRRGRRNRRGRSDRGPSRDRGDSRSDSRGDSRSDSRGDSRGRSRSGGPGRDDHHGGRPRRDERRPRSGDHHRSRAKSDHFETVCLALGRKDGLDEMDIQNLLRRQGRARIEDIGDIEMKDHESLIHIGSNSMDSVLQADGKHFKQFEIYVGKVKEEAQKSEQA